MCHAQCLWGVLHASGSAFLRAGNDLARVLHWGGSMAGYASYSARDMLRAVNQSTVALLDRWNVSIQPTVRDVIQRLTTLPILPSWYFAALHVHGSYVWGLTARGS